MSENENGNSPQEDPNEVKTTIGMPTPPRPIEEPKSQPLTALDQVGASPAADHSSEEAPLVTDDNVSESQALYNDDEKVSALTWPIDPNHSNAVSVLSEQLSGVELHGSGYIPPKPSRALNFILLLLVTSVGVAGSAGLKYYSSPDREARLMEKAICKADFDALTKMMAQKQYGTLVIESEPTQAIVMQSIDGGPLQAIMGKTADGKDMETLTPATLKDLDINRMYKFKLKFSDTLKRPKDLSDEEKKALKEGEKPPIEEMTVDYRDEEFAIARYQWIQDGATGSFRFQKIVPLTPDYIEYFHTFSWKKGKAERFETQRECEDFQRDNDGTICRVIPRTENWSKKDERDEEAAKKNKRGKRRRR